MYLHCHGHHPNHRSHSSDPSGHAETWKASSNWFILPAGRTKIKEGIVMMFASSVSIRWKNGPSNAEMYLYVCTLVIGDTCAVASFIKWTCAIITTRISSLGMLF